WVGSSSGDAFRGAGTEITQNPQVQSDGYHLKGVSSAIDAGIPNLTFVDIDGQTRPLNNGFDIGAVEVLKSALLSVSGGGAALQQALATVPMARTTFRTASSTGRAAPIYKSWQARGREFLASSPGRTWSGWAV